MASNKEFVENKKNVFGSISCEKNKGSRHIERSDNAELKCYCNWNLNFAKIIIQ